MDRMARMLILVGALAGCSSAESGSGWVASAGESSTASVGARVPEARFEATPLHEDLSLRQPSARASADGDADDAPPPPDSSSWLAPAPATAPEPTKPLSPASAHSPVDRLPKSGSKDQPAQSRTGAESGRSTIEADGAKPVAAYEAASRKIDRAAGVRATGIGRLTIIPGRVSIRVEKAVAAKPAESMAAPGDPVPVVPAAVDSVKQIEAVPAPTTAAVVPVAAEASLVQEEVSVPAAGSMKAPPGAMPGTSQQVGMMAGCADGEPVVRMVNSKRIRLNYEVKDVGQSGVAGVELWYTQDGRTWQRHPSGPQHTSPYVVEVEDEDLYGFTLVGHSGAGLGKQPPQPGDLPQVWVEVDVTRPVVRLLGVEAGTGPKLGTLTVLWSAADKNLASTPISLSYAREPRGPWVTVATGLPNTGRYGWHMPAGMPGRFFLRVEAIDRVGNIGMAQTPTPLLGDAAQPSITIMNVGAAAAN